MIRLKALLEETESDEDYQRACRVAEKCLTQEENDRPFNQLHTTGPEPRHI